MLRYRLKKIPVVVESKVLIKITYLLTYLLLTRSTRRAQTSAKADHLVIYSPKLHFITLYSISLLPNRSHL